MKIKTIIPCLLAMICVMSAANVSAAETCIIPPTCAALGFTKTETDCTGLDLLRCPLDQTKVFCSKTAVSGGGGSLNPDNPLSAIGSYNTYEPGSKFYDDKGNFLGYYAKSNIVFDFSKELFDYTDKTAIGNYCKNKTTGGAIWSNPSTTSGSDTYLNCYYNYSSSGVLRQSIYNVVKSMPFIVYNSSDSSVERYMYYEIDESGLPCFSYSYFPSYMTSMRIICTATITTAY